VFGPSAIASALTRPIRAECCSLLISLTSSTARLERTTEPPVEDIQPSLVEFGYELIIRARCTGLSDGIALQVRVGREMPSPTNMTHASLKLGEAMVLITWGSVQHKPMCVFIYLLRLIPGDFGDRPELNFRGSRRKARSVLYRTYVYIHRKHINYKSIILRNPASPAPVRSDKATLSKLLPVAGFLSA
jgi:hypothetical protein